MRTIAERRLDIARRCLAMIGGVMMMTLPAIGSAAGWSSPAATIVKIQVFAYTGSMWLRLNTTPAITYGYACENTGGWFYLPAPATGDTAAAERHKNVLSVLQLALASQRPVTIYSAGCTSNDYTALDGVSIGP